MANTFKRFPLQLDGTVQTVYTCPAGTTAVVIGFRLSNKDGVAPTTIKGYVNDGVNDYHVIGADTILSAQGALAALGGEKIVLQAGDALKLQTADASMADAYLSVMEVT